MQEACQVCRSEEVRGPQTGWGRGGGNKLDFKQVEQDGEMRNSKKNTRLAVRNKQLELGFGVPRKKLMGACGPQGDSQNGAIGKCSTY